SFAIVIPSAVAVFASIATIFTVPPVFTGASHWFAGFVTHFVIGGVPGFITASVPDDRQLTATYFVDAPLHSVIIGANAFAVPGAGPNPWDASTLEWATASPPHSYNFRVIPTVASRHPLWEDRMSGIAGRSSVEEGLLLDDGRETIGTTVLDAEPDVILRMP